MLIVSTTWILTALMLGLASHIAGAEPPPAPGGTATFLRPADLMALEEMAGILMEAGLPDARHAIIVIGNVTVTEKAIEKASVGGEYRPRVILGGDRVQDGIRTRSFHGMHFSFPDGRWMLAMNQPMAARPGREITVDINAVRIAPADAASSLAAIPNQYEGPYTDRFVSLFKPRHQARIQEAIAASKPLRRSDMPWMVGPDLLLLQRAGVPGSDAFILICGTDRLFPTYNPSAELTPPLSLMPEDHALWRWRMAVTGSTTFDPELWHLDHAGTCEIPDPIPVQRAQVSRWLRLMLTDPEALADLGTDAQRAARASVAILQDADKTAAQERTQLLLARSNLPEMAPKDAELAEQLQHWDPPVFDPGQQKRIPSDEKIARMDPAAQKHYRSLKASLTAWNPTAADVQGLLELLTDHRPCRWLDGDQAHCVGDNALRALAHCLRFDPRLLVGRDPAASWSETEREATARALRNWGRGLGDRPLEAALMASLGELPALVSVRMLTSRPESRPVLLDLIAKNWRGKPPPQIDLQDLGRLLATVGDHPAFSEVIASWPVKEQFRPLLAVWHELRGERSEFESYLDAAIADGNRGDAAAKELAAALRIAMRCPEASRLRRVMELLAGPIDDRRTWAPLASIEHGNLSNDYWKDLVEQSPGARMGADKLPVDGVVYLIATCLMLADARPIPDGLAVVRQDGMFTFVRVAGFRFQDTGPALNEARSRTGPPPSLRMCDVAAFCMSGLQRQIGLKRMASARIDLWAPPEERDRDIAKLREPLEERARSAASALKLPDVLPAPKPADGDKSLF
ncbi:MAG: hypothetical protein J0M02_17410 [Planctomycetes bacterium]|nr:hypothetical protein [Planctomycetota bacterium]